MWENRFFAQSEFLSIFATRHIQTSPPPYADRKRLILWKNPTYPQMSGTVNYYHYYSVYKLLVVNLTTRFERDSPAGKKISRLRTRARLRHVLDVDQAGFQPSAKPIFPSCCG
jgi:hypothetical protein